MSANKRLFYAVYQAAIARCGTNTFTSIHGLQSCGMNTKFNLEQVFEIAQLAIYENIEMTPEVEVTMEKILDGYPLLWHLGTRGASNATLAGRANARATIGVGIYSDVQESASGTALSQCLISGTYASSVGYNFQVQGNFTESVTFVGNNKTWLSSITLASFNNNDTPLALISGLGGINQKQDFVWYPGSNGLYTRIPTDIPGISASGTNAFLSAGEYSAHVQSIKVSATLGRDQLFELGQKGPYHRFVQFPVEVKTDIEIIDVEGDKVEALADRDNLSAQTINIYTTEGTYIQLGSKNKLSSVNTGGANAGKNGSNSMSTFSYITHNDFTVTHPQDPSGFVP